MFLPSKKLLKYTASFLQNWKNRYYSTKQKIILNLLGLLCRIEEINIFIILPSKKKSLNIPGVLCRFEETIIFFHSTKHEKSFINILGLLCRFEEINIFYHSTKQRKTPLIYWVFFAELKKINIFNILPSKNSSLNIGYSLQNWRNKYFYYSTKQKKLLKYTESSVRSKKFLGYCFPSKLKRVK